MAKNKLRKFSEMAEFKNVFQPPNKGYIKEDFELRGKWNKNFFKNSNPIILELGCGKGEYTIELAKRDKNKNYIGIDIKGARIWKGAKTAIDLELNNVAFLRAKVNYINNFFAENEISEIWITFPDPQPKKAKNRLTSDIFLNYYQKILKNNSIIHLKTDSFELFQYTIHLLIKNKIEPLELYSDIYSSKVNSIITQVQTHYEKLFLAENKKITYLSFRLNTNKNIEAPDKIEILGYNY